MSQISVVVVDENGEPRRGVTVAAYDTQNFPGILARETTNEAGLAIFDLSSPCFFDAFDRRGVSFRDRSYEGKVQIQIINNSNSPCYDYVLDGAGFGTHTTFPSVASTANFTNATVFICPGDYTITSQVNIFHDADEVVTFVGAGMGRVKLIGTQANGQMLNVSGPASPEAHGVVIKNLTLMADNPITLIRFGAGALSLEDVILDLDRGGGGVGINVPSGVSLSLLSAKFFGGGSKVGTGITFAAGSVDEDNASHHIVHCYFSTSVGIRASGGDDIWITNSDFLCGTRDVLLDSGSTSERVSFSQSRFTKGVRIESVGAIVHRDLAFSRCTWRLANGEIGIDYDHTTTSAAALGLSVTDCGFEDLDAQGTAIGIRGETDGPLHSTIVNNRFYNFTAGNEIVGILATVASGNQISHNTTNSGATLPDTHWATMAGDSSAFSLMQLGSGIPAHTALARTTFFAADEGQLYINQDGATRWGLPLRFRVYTSLGEDPFGVSF